MVIQLMVVVVLLIAVGVLYLWFTFENVVEFGLVLLSRL